MIGRPPDSHTHVRLGLGDVGKSIWGDGSEWSPYLSNGTPPPVRGVSVSVCLCHCVSTAEHGAYHVRGIFIHRFVMAAVWLPTVPNPNPRSRLDPSTPPPLQPCYSASPTAWGPCSPCSRFPSRRNGLFTYTRIHSLNALPLQSWPSIEHLDPWTAL